MVYDEFKTYLDNEYIDLTLRINQTKKSFSFSIRSGYDMNQQQNDKLRAMRLLCHAEFEEYFERIAEYIVSKSLESWKNDCNTTFALISLCSLYPYNGEKKDSVYTRICSGVKKHREVIRNNHGIRISNMEKMFHPLGYQMDDFDTMFISALDSFGACRGETAHTSRRLKQLLDKNTELDRVNGILKMIPEFNLILLDPYVGCVF